jgi:hypothetical protein
MNKTIIAALIGAGVVIAAVLWLNQPEPTPKEKLEDAAETAADALQDAGKAISDGAAETAESLKKSAEETAAEVTESAAQTANAAKAEATRLITAWEETGIVTEDGFSYENAITTVFYRSLDEPTKTKIVALIEQIHETPALFEEKMKEIREILKK